MKICLISIRKIKIPRFFNELNIFEIKKGSLKEKIKMAFDFFDSIIFIGSSGIVVRMISDFLKDKTTDPSIFVYDEKFKNLTLLCGSHMAGGHRIGELLSINSNSNFVYTTSTDINGLTGLDLFCRDNNLFVEKKHILYINNYILNNQYLPVSKDFKNFYIPKNFKISENPIIYLDREDKNISLFSKKYTLGIGFHKNTDFKTLNKEFHETIPKYFLNRINNVASIEKKWNTKTFHRFLRLNNIYNSNSFTSDSLNKAASFLNIKGNEYVKRATNAIAVSEPSAFLGSFNGNKVFEGKNNNSKFVIYEISAPLWRLNNYKIEEVPEVFYE
jgi:cobalt-precorrin 5A hydrolase